MASENILKDQLQELINVAKQYGSVKDMMTASVNDRRLTKDAKNVLDMAIFLQLYLKSSNNNDTEFAEECITKLNECADKLNA